MKYLGDFTTSNTAYIYFNTFDSNDPAASVTITGLAVTDIEIYKDGVATTRSSESGYTLLDTDGIDFDGIKGIHGISIDLSDNDDAGFFAAGSEYVVVVSSVTIDSGTVNFVAATFSIERAGGAIALLKGTNSLATIEGKIDAIPTTAMRGTNIGDLNNISVADILAGTPAASTGAPTTVGELLYFIREGLKNKLKYIKATDVMELYEDDGSTVKLSHAMIDDAIEATRGAGV